jgi:hypothetical protein
MSPHPLVAAGVAATRRHKEYPPIERDTVVPMPDEPAVSSKCVIEPGARIAEVLLGLIMVLTFTAAAPIKLVANHK